MTRDEFASAVVAQTDRMYRVARSLLHSDEDCRDAMQEAALRAWERRATLRDEGLFATWLIRILINECRNIQRRKMRVVPMEQLPESAAQAPDPDMAIALSRLPEKLRLPLVLHAVEGMDYAEIAQVLHLPKGAIGGRIHRAKQLLRKELDA